jgi:hypothetical protein
MLGCQYFSGVGVSYDGENQKVLSKVFSKLL